ncbi:CRISPR-associated protein Cas5 family [Actinobacteria bacterium OK074]|nr:CRISPR-associated protein Cas5 family [Actinobacteria bacterium OK074]
MTGSTAVLLLRFAGPLQSWGSNSEYNRRETQPQPTKSGVIGLLAAATGRRRDEPISDLVGLRMGVRVDQPGSLLRDYHTVSDYRGRPLLSSQVNAKGEQKTTSPAKPTYVTQRFYLEDAVFVAALQGPAPLIEGLAQAVRTPAFPLALGRRSCPPSRPLLLEMRDCDEAQDLEQALRAVEWQAADHIRGRETHSEVRLAATLEDPVGDGTANDVPVSFDLRTGGGRATRRVRHTWLTVATGRPDAEVSPATTAWLATAEHDPFDLLG